MIEAGGVNVKGDVMVPAVDFEGRVISASVVKQVLKHATTDEVYGGSCNEEEWEDWGVVSIYEQDSSGGGKVFAVTVVHPEMVVGSAGRVPIVVQIEMMGEDEFEPRLCFMASVVDFGAGFSYEVTVVDQSGVAADYYGALSMLRDFLRSQW